MNLLSFKKKLLLITMCSFFLLSFSSIVFASQNKAANKSPKKISKKVEVASKNQTKEEKEAKVQKELEQFVSQQLDSFNRTTLHSERKKYVMKNPNGTFTASYTHFNKESINCYFTEADNTKAGVTYIGHFSYVQEEYQCTADTEKKALEGPFTKKMQTPISEMAKYKLGKWSY